MLEESRDSEDSVLRGSGGGMRGCEVSRTLAEMLHAHVCSVWDAERDQFKQVRVAHELACSALYGRGRVPNFGRYAHWCSECGPLQLLLVRVALGAVQELGDTVTE